MRYNEFIIRRQLWQIKIAIVNVRIPAAVTATARLVWIITARMDRKQTAVRIPEKRNN